MLPHYEGTDPWDRERKRQENRPFIPWHLQRVSGRTDDLAMKSVFFDQKVLSHDHLRTVTVSRGFAALWIRAFGAICFLQALLIADTEKKVSYFYTAGRQVRAPRCAPHWCWMVFRSHILQVNSPWCYGQSWQVQAIGRRPPLPAQSSPVGACLVTEEKKSTHHQQTQEREMAGYWVPPSQSEIKE